MLILGPEFLSEEHGNLLAFLELFQYYWKILLLKITKLNEFRLRTDKVVTMWTTTTILEQNNLLLKSLEGHNVFGWLANYDLKFL